MSLFDIKSYSVVEELNKGAFCDAYKVTKGGKEYFMKLYKDPTCMSPDYEDFKKNQRTMIPILKSMGKLTETIVEDFEDGGRYYQVKEFIPGATNLRKWLASNCNYDERMDVAVQLCEIVKAVHKNNIIHQDLKPEQVMTVSDSSKKSGIRLILTDFDWSVPNGRIVRRVGTPGYNNIDTDLTYASDVFTLGIILCELLTGCNPYVASDSDEGRFYEPSLWFKWVEKKDYMKPNRINTDLPAKINDIIEKCLEPDSVKRPSIDDILCALGKGTGARHKAKLRAITGDMMILVPDMSYGRNHFKELFTRTTDAESNSIYKYLDKTYSTLSLTQSGDELYLSFPGYGMAKNKIMLNGAELTDKPTCIKNGDKISIFSTTKGMDVVTFTLEIV